MVNCTRSIIRTLAVAATISIGILLSGCTAVDDTLGKGLIPDYQKMKFGIATIDGVGTYIAKSDSIPTANLGRVFLGSMTDSDYGKTTCSGLLQFIPSYFSIGDDFYGESPVIDSVRLRLGIAAIHGKGEVRQKFYIYELLKLLEPDEKTNTFYSNFEVDATMVDFNKPIFSFTMKDEDEDTVSKRLVLEAGGFEFTNRLLALKKENYETDSTFRDAIKGFYIAQAPGESEDAAVYDMMLQSTTYGVDYMSLDIHTTSRVEDKDSTVLVKYTFDDGQYFQFPNSSVSKIGHDYTGSLIDESKFVDAFDSVAMATTLPPSEQVVYVHGMLGVSTYLRFTDDFVDKLNDLKMLDGEKCAMVINRARVHIWAEQRGVPYLDDAPKRLGMYYDYKGLDYSVREIEVQVAVSDIKDQEKFYAALPKSIIDYEPYQEIIYASQGYSSPYQGYFHRTENGEGFYTMDISMYITRLANNPDKTIKGVWIAPVMNSASLFEPDKIALQNKGGGDPKRIEVEIAYTLLKKR